jgi:SAM-dependent methyltransferase
MRVRPLIRALRRGQRPVCLGSLGSVRPVSWSWGYDRGQPVDRWYIERFLEQHRSDITGRVLEVKDSAYTDRFGHDVSERAILDVDAENERATHVADLAQADGVPSDTFDCVLLTQTLQYIFDVPAALAHARRILRPGGVLLVTLPVTSRLPDPPLTDYWRFTPESTSRLLNDAFGPRAVSVWGRGNVLTQVAFLKGLAAEDLAPVDLAFDDVRFPLIVCARAVRSA